MMTVAELIAELQTMPAEALVGYRCCSEQVLLEPGDVTLAEACAPRSDGWIQNARPDMPRVTYVMFPGN